MPDWPDPNPLATGPAPDRLGSTGPMLGPVAGGAVPLWSRHSPVPDWPPAGVAAAPRAHQPLVAAGVSRLSQGASARPCTPTPITPVSPLGSPTPSLTRRTARANSPASAGRSAGSRLVAASTSWSTAAGMPGTRDEGAGTSWLTCW